MDINTLKDLIEQNKSTHEIAAELNSSQTNIRYWLKKYDLRTQSGVYRCKSCGETQKDKFQNKGKGRLCYSTCKVCHNKQSVERFRRYKLQAVEYKGGKCCKCGYNKCSGSLHFHHLNPKEKDLNWRKMRTWKFENIKKELDKCILVCGNCHGEIHWDLDK